MPLRKPSWGMLGLGGFGLGLCVVGVAGLAAPIWHAVQPGPQQDGVRVAAAKPVAEPAAGGENVLVPGAAVAPRAVPRGGAVPAPGVPDAATGDREAATAQFRPTSIVLPSGRTATIQSVGLFSDGSLAVPKDPSVLGWWNGGAQAGEVYGGTVIAGHVDSRLYGLGALAELRKVRPGDQVVLRAGDRRVRYRVAAIQKIPQAALTTRTDAFRQDVPHRLIVITCGGPFDRERHRYRDNVVVTALPVG